MWRRFFSSHTFTAANSQRGNTMIPENVIGIVIAIAMAFLGFLEWRKMSREEKIHRLEELTQEAEQLYKTKKISDRLKYVTDKIEKQYPWLNSNDLLGGIEAAVFRLNRSMPVIIEASMSGEEIEPSGTQRASYWDGAGRHN